MITQWQRNHTALRTIIQSVGLHCQGWSYSSFYEMGAVVLRFCGMAAGHRINRTILPMFHCSNWIKIFWTGWTGGRPGKKIPVIMGVTVQNNREIKA